VRLLVLDDERGMAAFLATVARDRGWAVETAPDVEEFRRKFMAAIPDAVMLDLHLGKEDGVEQLRFLADRRFRGAVVLLSGFDARVLAAARTCGESLGLEVVAALEKPIRIGRLRQVMREIETALGGDRTETPTPPAAAESGFSPAEILAGVTAGELLLYLQPIVRACDHRLRRFEALCRWRHPRRGLVAPDRFIPEAERDRTVIAALTEWVVRSAIDYHRRLAAAGHNVPVSVNLSGVTLRALDFPDWVSGLVAGAGIPPAGLAFEVTESVAVSDPGAIAEVLARLRLKGFAVAMDDFGTGFSSLTALQTMPYSELKIDKTFVAGLPRSGEARSIVNSVVSLARNLSLDCVAEGVETAETATLLRHMGASGLQGYHFCRPLGFDDALRWAEERSTHASDGRTG
jgi:EAL domain-containing protein (putative c-di-GMP-specific phosphodiesterase class I)/ActR/RegA family two-component response regulator